MAKRVEIDDILEIPLGDGTHGYCRVLSGASYAVFDCRTIEHLSVEKVEKLPILFFVAVMNSAKRRWPKVGHLSATSSLIPPPKFIQSPLNESHFSLYWNDGRITRATKENCLGLERAAVWEPEDVEERLNDHYAKRQNKSLELQKIR